MNDTTVKLQSLSKFLLANESGMKGRKDVFRSFFLEDASFHHISAVVSLYLCSSQVFWMSKGTIH